MEREIDIITKSVELCTGFSIENICSIKRGTDDMWRALIIFAHEIKAANPNMTSIAVGKLMKRSHSSALRAWDSYYVMMTVDKEFKQLAIAVKNEIERNRGRYFNKNMYICIETNGIPVWKSLSENERSARTWCMEDFGREVKKVEITLKLKP